MIESFTTKWKLSITALLLTLSQETLSASVAAKEKDKNSQNVSAIEDVVVLHQQGEWFRNSHLYLSDSAGRFVARDGDMVIAASAPGWDIVMFSRKKNQGYTISNEASRRSGLGIMSGATSLRGKVVPSSEKIFGLKVVKIVYAEKADTARKEIPIYQSRNSKPVISTTLKLVTPFKMKPQLQVYVNWLCNLNRYGGVPAEITSKYEDGSTVSNLKTVSIEHTKKNSSFFAYPTGFKSSPNQMEVMLADDYAETLEDLWGSVPKKTK